MTTISVIISLIIIKILYRPILVLKETIVGLTQGQGDLTQRIEVKTNDDLGQISEGVNAFIANLQNMMLEICVSSHLVENVIKGSKLTDECDFTKSRTRNRANRNRYRGNGCNGRFNGNRCSQYRAAHR